MSAETSSSRTGRALVVAGAVLAGLAVALGAFGAHGLPEGLPPERVATYETAARYHMYHALALVAAGLLALRRPSPVLRAAAAAFGLGLALFSGSLYLLVLTDTPALGLVAPFGGGALIAGWGLLAWAAWRAA